MARKAAGPRARPRRPVAGRGRVRRDRLLDLLRARRSSRSYALGLTPWVLLAVGVLFLLVALSYAEGTAAIPETGGAAMFVRRAFNDPAGFLTGWVLFLDYLIVIALAALFVPHYFGARGRLGRAHATSPGTSSSGVGVILGVAAHAADPAARPLPARRSSIAVVAFVSHVLLVVLGGVLLVSSAGLGAGVDLGRGAVVERARVRAAARDARLHGARDRREPRGGDARRPGKTLPRSLFAGHRRGRRRLVRDRRRRPVGVSAAPDPDGPDGWATELGTTWLRAPLVGITEALRRPAARRRSSTCCASSSGVTRRLRPARRGRPPRSRARAGSPTRSRSTTCSRTRSRG